jgi:hypothetical protein
MSDNSNDLAFTIDNNIIEHFPLRAAAYQRLILDDQVGISKLVSNITRKQDETLHEFVKKNRKRAMMNKLDTDLDNIFKKRKEEIERIKNELILLYNNGRGTRIKQIEEVKKYYDMARRLNERNLYMKYLTYSAEIYLPIDEVDVINKQIYYKYENYENNTDSDFDDDDFADQDDVNNITETEADSDDSDTEYVTARNMDDNKTGWDWDPTKIDKYLTSRGRRKFGRIREATKKKQTIDVQIEIDDIQPTTGNKRLKKKLANIRTIVYGLSDGKFKEKLTKQWSQGTTSFINKEKEFLGTAYSTKINRKMAIQEGLRIINIILKIRTKQKLDGFYNTFDKFDSMLIHEPTFEPAGAITTGGLTFDANGVILVGISPTKAEAQALYDKLPDLYKNDDYDDGTVVMNVIKPPLDMDPAGAPMNTVLPPAWNNTSYILNYGMNPALTLDTIPQHQLNSIDYNISAIAQPYKAIAYYTQKQIAIPASEWYWHGKEQTFRVNLCRLQRTWSVSSSPYDKLALMRHAIMTYYVMADLSPLLEPFLIENVLEQKPMTNLFNDLNIQAQLQLENISEVANKKKIQDEDDETKESDEDDDPFGGLGASRYEELMHPPLDMDTAGAALGKAGLDAIQENTRVAITRETNTLYYRVKEFYKQQGHAYGFIVIDKDNKEYYLYAKDKDNDGDAAMGYHMYLSEQRDTLALLHNLLNSLDNQKTTFYQEGEEVTVQIGPEKLQTFDAYVQRVTKINTDSFKNRDRKTGRLTFVNTMAEFLNEIGSSYATYFDAITLDADDILILKKELQLDPVKSVRQKQPTRVFQVNNRSTILRQKFRPNATSKKKEGDNSLKILQKIVVKLEEQITRILKEDGIREISRLMQISTLMATRANQRITEILMKEIYVPYMQYVPEQDRTAFLKTYSVQLFGFMLSDDQIKYVPNQQSYNPYFQDLNEAVLEGTRHTEYLQLVLNNDNTNLGELEKNEIAALVDFYYEERAFLIASFNNKEVFPRSTKPGSLRKRPRDTSPLETDLINDYGEKKANEILQWLNNKGIPLDIDVPTITYEPTPSESISGFNIKPTDPDGNCLYHAIYNASIQQAPLFTVYNSDTCTEDQNGLVELSKENHVKKMRQDIICAIQARNVPTNMGPSTKNGTFLRVITNDWGGEGEISILSLIYNLHIKVWQRVNGVLTLVSQYPSERDESMTTINLYYRSIGSNNIRNHYDWLEPETQRMEVDDKDFPDIVPFMDPPGAALQTEAFIKAYLKKTDQLEDLKRLTNKTEDKLLEKLIEDVNKHIDVVPDANADVKKYIERVVNNTLYVKGNSGLVPYLCDAYSEQAVLKFIDAMKLYLKFGHKMARSGEPQTFYSENYKEFFQQRSWKTGIRRYAEFRKYKYPINDRSLQVDERVRDSVLENREAINAEHDIITLESSSSFANWSSIVRFALYEKYNFFLPAVHETLQGGMQRKVKDAEVYDDKGIFQELMDREAFDDFVYVYCTLYTLIFNT